MSIGEVVVNMIKLSVEKIIFALLIFSLVISPIELVPSAIGVLCRYLLIIFGILYLFIRRKKLITSTFHNLMYLYLILSIVSLVVSPYLDANLMLSTFQFVLYTIIVVNSPIIVDINEVFRSFFRVLLVVVCAATVYSLILILFGTHVYQGGLRYIYLGFIYFSQSVYGISQVDFGYSSFYGNPNIYGFYCMLLLCYLLFEGKFKKKSCLVLSWICTVVGILLSNSRGIFILSVLVVIIYMFYRLRPNNRMLLVPMLIVLAVAVVYLLYSSGVLSSEEFLTGRLSMWRFMINSIKEYPMFGIGFSASTKHLVGSMQQRVGSHNSYLNILCENGVVGFVIFIFIQAVILRLVFINLKNKFKNLDGYYLFATCIVLVSLAYAFFENQFMILDSRNLIWLLSCLTILRGNMQVVDSVEKKHSHPWSVSQQNLR